MDNLDEKDFEAMLVIARKSFAKRTSLQIREIEGLNGLQIAVVDLASGEIIKDSPLAKHISKLGYVLQAKEAA